MVTDPDLDRRTLPGRRADDRECDNVGGEDVRALIAAIAAKVDSEQTHTLRALTEIQNRLTSLENRLLRITIRMIVSAAVLAVVIALLGWIGPTELRAALRAWLASAP